VSGYYRCASCRSGTNIYRWGLFAVMLGLFLRKPPMKIIYTRQNKDGSYDNVGMNNQRLTSKYTTTNGFLRYGIPDTFRGHTLRLEVYYGDNIHRDPNKIMYVTV